MELRERQEDHLNLVVNSLRRIIQAIRLSSSAAHDTLGITGAQLFVLRNAGHSVHLEQPEAFTAALLGFLMTAPARG
jgi:pimeloyl-ACP methyl ester carboxylesterase